jgi:hypothetical protein
MFGLEAGWVWLPVATVSLRAKGEHARKNDAPNRS